VSIEQNVSELWSVVRHMTNIPALPSDSLVKARTSAIMQAAFVRQALKYLQERLLSAPLSVSVVYSFSGCYKFVITNVTF